VLVLMHFVFSALQLINLVCLSLDLIVVLTNVTIDIEEWIIFELM
jgi:hypothetical protein